MGGNTGQRVTIWRCSCGFIADHQQSLKPVNHRGPNHDLQLVEVVSLSVASHLYEALKEEHTAFVAMPDAMLKEGDPRYDWWIATASQRKRAGEVLAAFEASSGSTEKEDG